MIGGSIHNFSKKSFVQLKVHTWAKDSYGLFDYQAKPQNLETITFQLDRECKIYRNPQTQITTIQSLQENQISTNVPADSVLLGVLKINKEKDHMCYSFQAVKKQTSENEDKKKSNQSPIGIYTVARDFSSDSKNVGHIINPGNIIRLGRSQYKVIQIRNNDQTIMLNYHKSNDSMEIIEVQAANPKNSSSSSQKQSIQSNQQNPQTQHPLQCRICLMSQQKETDPLIAPCACKGSMKYIHLQCLQRQISGRVVQQSDFTINYNFQRLACTICDSPLTRVISVNGVIHEMLSLTKPNQPYIMLSSTKSISQNLNLLKLNQQSNRIRIGRSHQCQIRIDDISVSRAHAQIKFLSNQFYINDLKSKFGTLVKFENKAAHKLSKQSPIKLQFGRAAFEFKVIQSAQIESGPQSDIQ